MRLLQASRFRIKLVQVFWITLAWTLIGALDALNTYSISDSEYMKSIAGFNFARYFWVNTLSATFVGILSGSILVFYLREKFRSKPFGFTLLVNSLLISTINYTIIILAYSFFLNLKFEAWLFHMDILSGFSSTIRNAYYLKILILWWGIVFSTLIGLHVNEKYGPGILLNLLLGRYHHPREEERIFMFVDIKSSTTIAEQLGHIRFFDLLNDFFRDITNSIIYTSGEVYQYVGDEVVISWSMKNGIENANCIRCFYSMQETIKQFSTKYTAAYGVLPEFKAGLHCGLVTTGEIGVIKKDIVFSGDVMNTTSRIQDLCNSYGVKILLSKDLLDHLNLPPHDYKPERVGVIELKGKRNKVELYTFEDNLTESRG